MSVNRSVRRLHVALSILFGLIVALVAGILARANASTMPGAILYGGSAFGVALSLALSVLEALKRP